MAWFQVFWQATGPLTQLDNSDAGFSGTFRRAEANIEWSAVEPALNFRFKSDPLKTSTTVDTAVIGQESNGVFFSG